MQAISDGYAPLWHPADPGGLPFAQYVLSQSYSPITWLLTLCDPEFE